MSDPIYQHIVPHFLLKRFVDKDGFLNVFDSRHPNSGIWKRKPGKVLGRKHLYTQIEEDGTKDPTVEKGYLSDLEDRTAPIVEEIVRAVRMKEVPALGVDQRRTFIEFLYIQLTRIPERRDFFIEEAKKDVNISGIEERIWKNSSIATLGYLARNGDFIERLASQRICFSPLRNPDAAKKLIIGSDPSVRLDEGEKIFFGNSHMESWLPLATDVAVAWSPADSDVLRELKDKDVWKLNLKVFEQSAVIAGCSRELIESLVSSQEDSGSDSMTAIDAVFRVLRVAGTPLHHREITKRMF